MCAHDDVACLHGMYTCARIAASEVSYIYLYFHCCAYIYVEQQLRLITVFTFTLNNSIGSLLRSVFTQCVHICYFICAHIVVREVLYLLVWFSLSTSFRREYTFSYTILFYLHVCSWLRSMFTRRVHVLQQMKCHTFYLYFHCCAYIYVEQQLRLIIT